MPLAHGWLDVAETAEILQVDEETVRRYLRAGDLPGTLFARRYRIPVDALRQYMAARGLPVPPELETPTPARDDVPPPQPGTDP